MEKALDVASKIEDDVARALSLHIILPHMINLPVKNLYLYWRKNIQILGGRTRSNLLMDITFLLPIINILGED